MRKTIFLLCLVLFTAFLATQTKAQQPVSPSERRVVIKALETKIAELEVKRAIELPTYIPTLIDEQLVNLRKRLAELIGKRRSIAGRSAANALNQRNRKTKIKKMT